MTIFLASRTLRLSRFFFFFSPVMAPPGRCRSPASAAAPSSLRRAAPRRARARTRTRTRTGRGSAGPGAAGRGGGAAGRGRRPGWRRRRRAARPQAPPRGAAQPRRPDDGADGHFRRPAPRRRALAPHWPLRLFPASDWRGARASGGARPLPPDWGGGARASLHLPERRKARRERGGRGLSPPAGGGACLSSPVLPVARRERGLPRGRTAAAPSRH